MWRITRVIDLQKPDRLTSRSEPIPIMYPGDAQAHTIELTVMNGGSAATLSGTPYGFFTRADGQTVIVAGTLAGNVVTVTLSYDCYAVQGVLRAVIRIGNPIIDPGDPCTSLLEVDFFVRDGFGDTYTPSGTFPTLEALAGRVSGLEALGLTTDGTTLTSSKPLRAVDGITVVGGRDNVLDENGDKIIPRTGYVYSSRISATYTYNSNYKFLDMTVEEAGFYLFTSYLGSYSFPNRDEYSATTFSVTRAGETNSTTFGLNQYTTNNTITYQNTVALEYFNVGDRIVGNFTRTWYNNSSTVSISGFVYVVRLP